MGARSAEKERKNYNEFKITYFTLGELA